MVKLMFAEEDDMPRLARYVVVLMIASVALWIACAASADASWGLVERWTAVYHHGWDTARGIDGNQQGIVVVGTSGIVFYDEDGRERVSVLTEDAQNVVRLVETVAYVGGDHGVAAYALDGTRMWSFPLAGGCQAIGTTRDRLMVLSEGKLVMISLAGTPIGEIPLEFAVRAIDTLGDAVAAVGQGQCALYRNGRLIWQLELPFSAVDVALDEFDGLWVAGERTLARLSQVSGIIQWTKPMLGTSTALATTLVPTDVHLDPHSPMIPGVAVVGYCRVGEERDFMTSLVSRDGVLLWRAFLSGGHGDDVAYSVTSLPNGDIVVTGVSPFAASADSEDDYLTVCYTIAQHTNDGSPDTGDELAPTADFAWEPLSPLARDRIVFSSQAEASQGNITSWGWLVDGTHPGVGRTYGYSFPRSGWYEVALMVEDCGGRTATHSKSIYVQNRPPEVTPRAQMSRTSGELIADFDWSVVREQRGSFPDGFSPEGPTTVDNIRFLDRSSGSSTASVAFDAGARDLDGHVVSIEWDFGDGMTSQDAAPVHVYAAAGSYEVVVRVTDDEGAVSVATLPLEITAGGAIRSWEWAIGGPGSYLQGTSSSSNDPVFGFTDNSSESPFEVTLTVEDEEGNTASTTQWIDIHNVPPTARFSYRFTGEPILPLAEDIFWGGEGNRVMAAPHQPAQSGIVEMIDASYDGEPWQSIFDWYWDFDGDYVCHSGEEGCDTTDSPHVLFATGGEGGLVLFRGTRLVGLSVWDDDGEVADTAHFVQIANIAPYAGFEWMHDEWWWNQTTPTCTGGDTSRTGSDGPFSVTREIQNWETGDAVFVPWGWWWTAGQVTLSFSGAGDAITIEETVPSGWTIEYWGEDLAVIGNALVGTIYPGEGGAVVQYEISPPQDGEATQGTRTVSGTFISTTGGGEEGDPDEEYTVSLNSRVVLCTTVDVETQVEFRAFGDEDTWTGYVDPNGDSVSFSWSFGTHGAATDQWVILDVHLQGVQARYVDWDWMWSGSLTARLTVRDSQGASTSVDTSVELEGYCSGGAPM